jgi:hypothetical protein
MVGAPARLRPLRIVQSAQGRIKTDPERASKAGVSLPKVSKNTPKTGDSGPPIVSDGFH